MRASLLDTIVTFYEDIQETSKYGSISRKWVKCFSTKARLLTRSGSRGVIAYEETTTYNQQFEVRFYHLSKLKEGMRINVYDRFYTIDTIIPDKSQAKLTLNTTLVQE